MKKIKFALKMKDSVEARTLKELQEAFDINQVLAYFLDGKLLTWLEDRYYDEQADKVAALRKDDPELKKKICDIFEVECEDNTLSIEEMEERNRKIQILRGITDDEDVINHVDSVAFSQEDLADLLDAGNTTIYLCGDDFRIPSRVKNITYVYINTKLKLDHETMKKYESQGIRIIGAFDENSKGIFANEKEDTSVEEFDENQAVFLCKYSDDIFFAKSVSGKSNYVMSDSEDEEDELGLEYCSYIQKIKTLDVLKVLDAKCENDKILYLGEDGLGTFFASMKVDGKQHRIIRRWDENELQKINKYVLGKHGLIAETIYTNEDDEDDCIVERISLDGVITKITGNPFIGWKNHIETQNGYYSLDVGREWDEDADAYTVLNVRCLLHDDICEKEYKLKIKQAEDCGGFEISAWYVDKNEIYFFLTPYETTGRFYCFNTETKTIRLVSKIDLEYRVTAFCVSDKQIIYIGADEDERCVEMLSLSSGKQTEVWSEITGCSISKEIVKKGNYIYFPLANMGLFGIFGYSKGGEYCYRCKTDGTERTILEVNPVDIQNNRQWEKMNMQLC